jgi:diguanylate cyclase (GGDEF)-like protein
MTDVGLFHDLNNLYGHDVGDDVLRKFAGVLQGAVGASGKVYRFGGEEFAILLPGARTLVAAKMAEDIRKNVAEIICSDARPTISAGVATYPSHGSHRVALFRAADAALLEAKRGGRNRVCVAKNTSRYLGQPKR